MRSRPLPLLAIAASLLAFGVIAGGCIGGGGSGLTLAEYFQKLDALDNTQSEQSDALDAKLESDTADLEEAEAVALVQETVPEFIPIFQGFIDEASALEPPDEVEDAHNEALEALRDFVAVFQGIIGDDLAKASSFEDLEAAFTSAEFSAADGRLTEACLALERVATDHDITVDLDCEETT